MGQQGGALRRDLKTLVWLPVPGEDSHTQLVHRRTRMMGRTRKPKNTGARSRIAVAWDYVCAYIDQVDRGCYVCA